MEYIRELNSKHLQSNSENSSFWTPVLALLVECSDIRLQDAAPGLFFFSDSSCFEVSETIVDLRDLLTFAFSKIAKTYFLSTSLVTPPVSPLWGTPTPNPRGECFAPRESCVLLVASRTNQHAQHLAERPTNLGEVLPYELDEHMLPQNHANKTNNCLAEIDGTVVF